MKREKIIDLGELIKSFWKATPEEIEYEEGGTINADLTGIDTKIWDEANINIKSIEKSFIASEKEGQKENKRRKSQVTQTNLKEQEAVEKNIQSRTQNEKDREIGE